MSYVSKLLFAFALGLGQNAIAADTSTVFEIDNNANESITIDYKPQGGKKKSATIKAFKRWTTTLDHSSLPTLHIKTNSGDESDYEFTVADSESIKLVFSKNWKTKEAELKAKFASRNISNKGIKKAEVAQKEEEPAKEETPTEEATKEEPAKEEEHQTAEEPAAEEHKTAEKPKAAKDKPAATTSTLKVTPEQLLDVEAGMSDVDKDQQILGVKFVSDLRVATGEQKANSAADRTRAQAEVTKAFKAQSKLWNGAKKLSYKIVATMKRHNVTVAKDQTALAAKTLALIQSTYDAVEKKFAK